MFPFKLHPNTKTAYSLIFASLIFASIFVAAFQFVPVAQVDETIVFMRHDGHDMEIFSINADGTETQLTDNDYEDWAAVWSLDKSEIYFHSNQEGYYAIYSMNRDGTGVMRLSQEGRDAQFPTPSPDGNYLAFQMDMGNGNWDIFVMGLDGCSDFDQVTFGYGFDGGAAWSPDGSKIAYHSTDAGYYDIYVVNLDGTGTERLTYQTDTMDVWAQWSPDGSQIVFHSERDGNSELYVMNADGSSQVNLSNHSALDRTPRYSADGEHIIFRSERSGNSELYIMDLDGTNIRPITQSSLMNYYPNQ